jgi:hypothetical protein
MLAGILDYAGMFPPAQLPIEQAIRNYARYRQEPESWMLGRFICPASALAELSPHVDALFSHGPPLVISALGKGGSTIAEFLSGLADDLNALLAFRARHGKRAVVDTIEVRLSPNLLAADDGKNLRTVVFGPDELLQRADVPPLLAYYEVPFGPEWFVKLAVLIGALVEDEKRRKGFKLRCGGATASTIPSVDDVAFAICACRTARVPFKFTAGLHHPVRHFDTQLQAQTHGFLNVFGAGVLCHALGLSTEQLRPILEDAGVQDFVFDEFGFRWKNLGASTASIESARRHAVLSFGSCSFDEPRDDLRAMGLLS